MNVKQCLKFLTCCKLKDRKTSVQWNDAIFATSGSSFLWGVLIGQYRQYFQPILTQLSGKDKILHYKLSLNLTRSNVKALHKKVKQLGLNPTTYSNQINVQGM
jgi:hypothetical protein